MIGALAAIANTLARLVMGYLKDIIKYKVTESEFIVFNSTPKRIHENGVCKRITVLIALIELT